MPFQTVRIVAFSGYALILYLVGFLWSQDGAASGFLVSFLAVPLCLGAFSQVIFDPDVKVGFYKVAFAATAMTMAMFLVLYLIGIEAAICIVIGVPIILPLEFLGVYLTRLYLTREKGPPRKLYTSLFVVPLLALPLDRQVVFPMSFATLRSEIVISAPVGVVWDHTVVIPTIQPDERIWTISHVFLRAPQPVSATIDGDVRDLQWTKGVRFQEIITAKSHEKYLAWRFHFSDPASLASFDPHISPNSDMLNVSDGFYALETLPDGQTRLVLETHYQIRSPFNPYLRLWGALFLNDFHNSVLAVIKIRSETQAQYSQNGHSQAQYSADSLEKEN